MLIKEEKNRLFLQHGPTNVVLEAFGGNKNLAYNNVKKYFETILGKKSKKSLKFGTPLKKIFIKY